MTPFHHLFRPWTALVVLGAFNAAVILAAFFYFDVLTAVTCLAAPLFVTTTLGLAAQPSAILRRDAGSDCCGAGFHRDRDLPGFSRTPLYR
jgi:hypothetical protein